jgi:GNAT superfamily N-acetyltransferase
LTGWYRRIVDDAALAGLEHAGMVGWLATQCGQVPGALVKLEAGLAIVATGNPIPLFNQVVVGDGATADQVAAGVAILRARGAPFWIVLRRGLDDHFRPMLAELGLHPGATPMPGMALDPIPMDLAGRADGLDIHLVEDGPGLRDHARVVSEAYGLDEAAVATIIGERLWERDGNRVYLGESGGRAVAVGMSRQLGTSLGIYTMGTIPEARGRGFGRAMTERLILDGAAVGCTTAVLEASAMGRPLYERIGFRVVQAYDLWVD